ncbi:MAG TPA: hypothetical protein VKV39_05895 [Candidatus Sulfotelmatobacter sp.]|nr:hypothetical protein [Candidatus Sulfotelmatobacter sp.]
MSIRRKSFRWLLAGIVLGLLASATAFADDDPDRTQFGHNITIGPNEQAGDVTCFGCSIHVRGHVSGDVTTFGGSIVLEDQAEVNGDATVFGGGVRLDKDVKVGGGVSVFGGHVRRDPGATVQGDITSFTSMGWMLAIFVLPFVFAAGILALIVWAVWRLVRRTPVPQPASALR